MDWAEFERVEPELAGLGRCAFGKTSLVLVGTLRKDGWPRISPVEPMFVGNELYLGMMWRSVKAHDLLRDSRCTVHNSVSNRDGTEGEFKLYSRAREVTDSAELDRFREAVEAKYGPLPEGESFHCFAIDIESAAYAVLVGEEFQRQVWKCP